MLSKKKPLLLSNGVPQGNVLGPSLYDIYFPNIAFVTADFHVHPYADDTITYTCGSSLTTAPF